MESIREIRHDLGSNQVMSIHVTLIPYIAAAGELKTNQLNILFKNLEE